MGDRQLSNYLEIWEVIRRYTGMSLIGSPSRCSNIARITDLAKEEVTKELRITVKKLEVKYGRFPQKPNNGSITRGSKKDQIG